MLNGKGTDENLYFLESFRKQISADVARAVTPPGLSAARRRQSTHTHSQPSRAPHHHPASAMGKKGGGKKGGKKGKKGPEDWGTKEMTKYVVHLDMQN